MNFLFKIEISELLVLSFSIINFLSLLLLNYILAIPYFIYNSTCHMLQIPCPHLHKKLHYCSFLLCMYLIPFKLHSKEKNNITTIAYSTSNEIMGPYQLNIGPSNNYFFSINKCCLKPAVKNRFYAIKNIYV